MGFWTHAHIVKTRPKCGLEQQSQHRRERADWVRFEIDCYERCRALRDDLWEQVSKLMTIGKHGGYHTGPQIIQMIELEEVTGELLVTDENALIDIITWLKGFGPNG